jgi:hydrogenase nickel incorporation protein HypA/HybF
MHELSIAQSLVDVSCEEAKRVGARRVQRVYCRVGVLRQIEPDILRDAFGIVGEGTLCDGAELNVQVAPLVAHCAVCDRQFVIGDDDWICPHCGNVGGLCNGGDELEITSLDVEDDA